MHMMIFCSNVHLRALQRQINSFWGWIAAGLLYVDWAMTAVCRKQLAENNGQGWVILSDYKNKHTSIMQTKNAITPNKNADKVTMKYLNRQSLLNAALWHSKNKSVPALRANVSWETRPTLARGIILTFNRVELTETHTKKTRSVTQSKCISL